jgi:hypothetical protein
LRSVLADPPDPAEEKIVRVAVAGGDVNVSGINVVRAVDDVDVCLRENRSTATSAENSSLM